MCLVPSVHEHAERPGNTVSKTVETVNTVPAWPRWGTVRYRRETALQSL